LKRVLKERKGKGRRKEEVNSQNQRAHQPWK